MGRLFAGTPWDRPPSCERCGRVETECTCPPPVEAETRKSPQSQTARVRTEKRPRGKVVTVVKGLELSNDDLAGLAATLKQKCGTGGTAKDGLIELQGDHLALAENLLATIGYRVKKG